MVGWSDRELGKSALAGVCERDPTPLVRLGRAFLLEQSLLLKQKLLCTRSAATSGQVAVHPMDMLVPFRDHAGFKGGPFWIIADRAGATLHIVFFSQIGAVCKVASI